MDAESGLEILKEIAIEWGVDVGPCGVVTWPGDWSTESPPPIQLTADMYVEGLESVAIRIRCDLAAFSVTSDLTRGSLAGIEELGRRSLEWREIQRLWEAALSVAAHP
jgi:hypothetical protein